MIVADLVGIMYLLLVVSVGFTVKEKNTFDISRDLEELANLNVAVVCAELNQF